MAVTAVADVEETTARSRPSRGDCAKCCNTTGSVDSCICIPTPLLSSDSRPTPKHLLVSDMAGSGRWCDSCNEGKWWKFLEFSLLSPFSSPRNSFSSASFRFWPIKDRYVRRSRSKSTTELLTYHRQLHERVLQSLLQLAVKNVTILWGFPTKTAILECWQHLTVTYIINVAWCIPYGQFDEL